MRVSQIAPVSSRSYDSCFPFVKKTRLSFLSLFLDTMPASRDLSDLTKIVVPTGNNWDNEVEDDLEGEQETMPDLSDQVEPPSQLKRKADEMDDDNEKAQKLKSSVAKLSKGVTEKTHDEYIRCVFIE